MAAALVALLTWIVLAASTVFAAGTGIECGWQPMPDGTASYECVIQVTPELLSSLRRGDSIPLTVDVPEQIRPISRIRLIAGNEVVPRQALAANLKPWPAADKQPRDGIVETQFTTSNSDPRYGSQQATSGAVVPLDGYVAQVQSDFTRQLQNGGQAVREAVGQMTQDVLPPDSGRSVAHAIDRAGQELGNNLRSASDSVQNDIRQLFGNEPAAGNSSEILPPSSQQRQPILPSDNNAASNSPRQLDQPVTSTPSNNWQSSQPQSRPSTGNDTISPPNSFDNQWADGSAAGNGSPTTPTGDRYNTAQQFGGNSGAVLPQDTRRLSSNQGDQFGNPGQKPSGALPLADSRNGSLGNSQSAGSGPSFPAFTPSVGNEQTPITPTPVASSSTAEIRRDMLDRPANAEIQGANGLPIGQQPVALTQVASQTTATQTSPSPNSFGWDTKPQTQPASTQQLAGPTSAAPDSVLPLLLSWVLLSGSGAGNLYLFWSYVDVRNKYRDLVDEAARRISGRRIRD